MAKTDNAVSFGGSALNTITLLADATRKQGGNLGEAFVLLGKPEHAGAVDEMAAIAARVSKQYQAALEAAERVRVVNKTTVMVNLAAAPKLPFNSATIEKNFGGGWVKVENKKGSLYIDGKKVVPHLEEGQKAGTIRGHELREALSGKPVLHPNVLDALFDHAHLIPEDFKQDEQGRTRYIFFWAVIYRYSDSLFVRCLCWRDGAWLRHFRWLDGGFGAQDPAAVSAS